MKTILLSAIIVFLAIPAFTQATYTFVGNGNWSDTANWLNHSVPPTLLPKSDKISIDPISSGECVLDVQQIISQSNQLEIQTGKKFSMSALLSIENELNSNVHVIDSTLLRLVSDSQMLSQGNYQFLSDNPIPAFAVGDYIVGGTGEGYICKVIAVEQARPGGSRNLDLFSVLLKTIKAKLTDVLKTGSFSVDLPVDNSMQGKIGDLLSVDIPEISYTQGPVIVTLSDINIALNPKWRLDCSILNSTLNFYEIISKQVKMTTSFKLKLSGSAPLKFELARRSLGLFKKSFYTVIPIRVPFPPFVIPLPVNIVMNLELVLQLEGSVDAAITTGILFTSTNTFDLGARYTLSGWKPIYKHVDFSSTAKADPLSLFAKANISASIGPELSFKLYGIVGPVFSKKVIAEGEVAKAIIGDDWNQGVSALAKTSLELDAGIFGAPAFNFAVTTQKETIYEAPYKIRKFLGEDGDNQKGDFNEYLPKPIKVEIFDDRGDPVKDVPVYFTVTNGGGSVSNEKVLTDMDGIADTDWKLGPEDGGDQKLTVIAKKADGTLIKDAPCIFTATAGCTFTDPRDGQVYPCKQIGTQVWMTKNLNYASPSGSWCYKEIAGNCDIYGRLYDWNTALTVAPPGWHLPSDAEWITLTTFLGGELVAGGAMKATTLWEPPNGGATNSSGFTGLPGGGRAVNAEVSYTSIGRSGNWWSSTESDAEIAWIYSVSWNNARVSRLYYSKTFGYSVRCVKD